jgi:hypothetical protein
MDANVRVRRRYRRDTLILETEFTTADGSGAIVLIDFMLVRGGRASSHLVRLVSASAAPCRCAPN